MREIKAIQELLQEQPDSKCTLVLLDAHCLFLIRNFDRVFGINRPLSTIVIEELVLRHRCRTGDRQSHLSIEAPRGIRPDAEDAVCSARWVNEWQSL